MLLINLSLAPCSKAKTKHYIRLGKGLTKDKLTFLFVIVRDGLNSFPDGAYLLPSGGFKGSKEQYSFGG
jgi:hypothetical protein